MRISLIKIVKFRLSEHCISHIQIDVKSGYSGCGNSWYSVTTQAPLGCFSRAMSDRGCDRRHLDEGFTDGILGQ